METQCHLNTRLTTNQHLQRSPHTRLKLKLNTNRIQRLFELHPEQCTSRCQQRTRLEIQHVPQALSFTRLHQEI